MALLRDTAARNAPALGICLGAQLLAQIPITPGGLGFVETRKEKVPSKSRMEDSSASTSHVHATSARNGSA